MRSRCKRDIFSEDIWDTLYAPDGNESVLHPRQSIDDSVELAPVGHGLAHDEVDLVAVTHDPQFVCVWERFYDVDGPQKNIEVGDERWAQDLDIIQTRFFE